MGNFSVDKHHEIVAGMLRHIDGLSGVDCWRAEGSMVSRSRQRYIST